MSPAGFGGAKLHVYAAWLGYLELGILVSIAPKN